MQMTLIKCLLFLHSISGIEGLGKLGERDYSSVNQRMMKRILESCYENSSLSDPIIIFGDFNEPIDERSIIRIDRGLNVNKAYEKRQLLKAGASKVILIADSPRELISHLSLLKKTRWWNPKVPHFIIDKSNRPCKNVADILVRTWRMDIINSIHICAESIDKSSLYTMNSMANYAPYPWQLRKVMRSRSFYLYIFHRVSDTNTSCEHLNYDKTKLLHKYPITIVEWLGLDVPIIPRDNPLHYFNSLSTRHYKLLRSTIKALNAWPRFELENHEENIMLRIFAGTADLSAAAQAPQRFFGTTLGNNFPHDEEAIVAVIRLKPEVTTLEKIRKLWSAEVLIFAAIALTFLIAVLTIINHDFPAAMLDTIRLLIYSSILTNNRTHPFRIYLTTMLIFMVISNGVFQGKIAAFLTTEERGTAFGTINELMKKGYKMYARSGLQGYIQRRLPEYDIKAVKEDECIQLVLNNTNHVCFITKSSYEKSYILYPLDCVKEKWTSLLHFVSRQDWPLANRFNDMIMRHVESGIVNFWKMNDTLQQIRKRQEKEAEWSSPQYKPVRLYKLTFAFQLLAIGLSLSTFVFFLELLVAKYGTR